MASQAAPVAGRLISRDHQRGVPPDKVGAFIGEYFFVP
jgi:hypothetical protein